MKSVLKRLSALMLWAVLLFTACGRTPAASAGAEAASVYTVKTILSEEAAVTLETGETRMCSYTLPQLTGGSAETQKINDEILNLLNPVKEKSFDEIGKGDGLPECTGISWQSFRSGAVLSLVIETDHRSRAPEVLVYLFDCENGTRLSREELLARAGTDSESFLHALTPDQAAGNAIAKDLLTGDAPVFLNDGGELCTAVLPESPDENQTVLCFVPVPDQGGRMQAAE